MIRFGVCAKFEKLDDLIEAGYDYIEANLSSIEKKSEEEFAQIEALVNASPLKAEACNGFFPGSILVVGEHVEMDAIAAYTERALSRAARLGAKVAVLGSSKSRFIPEGFPYETAYAQFCAVLKLCGDIAAKYGITIAIEPLCCKETNFINTVAEGLAVCKDVAHPNVKCLADFYHVSQSGESLDDIRNAGDLLVHVHLADPDREMPESEEDIALCKQWAQALNDCGFQGRLSLEGRYKPEYKEDILRTRKILDLFNA